MSKPLIVITAGKHVHTHPARDVVTTIVGVDIDYLMAVALAGGAAMVLPTTADHEAIRTVLQAADGLLLTGGGDIHAEVYGEALHPAARLHDPDRDNMEMEVLRQARAQGLPVLGICRGMQLLNVASGGTLLQDIPSELPHAGKHNAEEHETVLHPIHVEEGTLLARVLRAGTVMVNSWHHQAVARLGEGLRVAATADDGVVEALEDAGGAPVLAMQCHPEVSDDALPRYLTLFHWLIEEAGKVRDRR